MSRPLFPQVLASAGDSTAPPGSYRKPPVRYILGVERRGTTLLSLVRCGRTSPLRSGGAARTRHGGPGKISRRPTGAAGEFFTLFSEAGSNIVESVAIPLAARSEFVIAAVAV